MPNRTIGPTFACELRSPASVGHRERWASHIADEDGKKPKTITIDLHEYYDAIRSEFLLGSRRTTATPHLGERGRNEEGRVRRFLSFKTSVYFVSAVAVVLVLVVVLSPLITLFTLRPFVCYLLSARHFAIHPGFFLLPIGFLLREILSLRRNTSAVSTAAMALGGCMTGRSLRYC